MSCFFPLLWLRKIYTQLYMYMYFYILIYIYIIRALLSIQAKHFNIECHLQTIEHRWGEEETKAIWCPKIGLMVKSTNNPNQQHQKPMPTISPSPPNKVFRSSISGVVIVVVQHYIITSVLLMFFSLVRKSPGVQVFRAVLQRICDFFTHIIRSEDRFFWLA